MAKKVKGISDVKTGFSLRGFDLAHYKRTEDYVAAVDWLHNQAIADFARMAVSTKVNPDKPFSFNDYPGVKKEAAKITQALTAKITAVVESGSAEQWLFANKKNDGFLRSIMDTSKVNKRVLARYQDRNLLALKQFQQRKVNGLNLSERIWQQTDQFKKTMELGIDVGLGSGKSAQALSQDLRQNLLDPDRLFRRVRDKRGNLQLSKAAKAFTPGQGVYRSSYKNSMRLTRTEVNMSYRTADNMRQKKLDFIVGFEVKLSNNHTLNGKPFTDICDDLAGKYPKDFVFHGWHPQCKCFSVPILQDPDEFDTDELNEMKAALNGTEYKKNVSKNAVSDVPDNFKSWAAKNQVKVDGYKSPPYFIRDNFKNGKIADGINFNMKVAKAAKVKIPTKIVPPAPVNVPTDFEKYSAHIDGAEGLSDVKSLMAAQLKNNLGYDTRILMSGTDTSVETAKAYAKEFVKLTDEYDLELPCTKFYTTQSTRHYGQVSFLDSAGNKAKYVRDLAAKAQNSGQNTDPSRLLDVATYKSLCDVDRIQLSTINHEFAHNLFISNINKSTRALSFQSDLARVRAEYNHELSRLYRGTGKASKELKDIYLGKYASTNLDEFLAEAFQEFKNRKSPSKYAKLVGDLVDKYYKKK